MNEPFCTLAAFLASIGSLGIPMYTNCWYLSHSPKRGAEIVPLRFLSTLPEL